MFLLTSSLLPPEVADAFFAAFQRAVDNILRSDEHLLAYGRWATDMQMIMLILGIRK